ncbi:hypothetical protein MTQ10_29650 [Streptomyces sp. XM83C]|jgi:hypothetical protein|uniref:AG1 protein n=1 Tax=Streptomyces thermocoprophilus TaxID=78356 RepID=A0ABV5VNS0_9ACTN|nr:MULTISPECIES: hypothetical protein [Streptomyces]MCK1823635.1 hypothetical protein [Streptomyces sp. XM83C]RSR96935.1 hypothetical protein EF917_22875 [Streptomyces sp. WAC00469]GGV83800.1 hypothetical protein GCM10010499_51310 [Streptomyces thermoviolaceus subsp. apingens]
MAWEEWEQLKSRAIEGKTTHLQLNGANGSTGNAGRPDLVVHQDDLGAVGHEAFQLHARLRHQADIAGAGADENGSGTTMQAAAELKSHHFSMGSALETTVSVWTTQVKAVLQALAHISNHLDYSKKTHAHDDAKIAADMRCRDGSPVPVSVLSSYFK